MLKAKHHIIIFPIFKLYTNWILKRNFNKINIIGEFNERKMPVVLISNHISWWDGFWAWKLNSSLLHRKFHFMMLEEQLRKYWFFNYTGGFSINKKNKSVFESLKYTSELLTKNTNLVLLFPQGRINSAFQGDFVFEKGIERILKGKENQVHLLFTVNLTDYFSNYKPVVNIYIKEYNEVYNLENIQARYNEFYKLCIENQKKIIA